jgi:hypothetical protein
MPLSPAQLEALARERKIAGGKDWRAPMESDYFDDFYAATSTFVEEATTDTLRTVMEEAAAFNTRHNCLFLGGLIWGLWRAWAECPDCPGSFRVPLDEDRIYWTCPNCRKVWQRREKEEADAFIAGAA